MASRYTRKCIINQNLAYMGRKSPKLSLWHNLPYNLPINIISTKEYSMNSFDKLLDLYGIIRHTVLS